MSDDAGTGLHEYVLDDGMADDLADVALWQPGGRRNVCKRGFGARGEGMSEAEAHDGLLAEELVVLFSACEKESQSHDMYPGIPWILDGKQRTL